MAYVHLSMDWLSIETENTFLRWKSLEWPSGSLSDEPQRHLHLKVDSIQPFQPNNKVNKK